MKIIFCHIILFFFFSFASHFSKAESPSYKCKDSLIHRHNLFIEAGGASFFGSVGYAFKEYMFKRTYFLELKFGVLYFQDKIVKPNYWNYYLLPHLDFSVNKKYKKMHLSLGTFATPVLNPYILLHPDGDYTWGPTIYDSPLMYTLVGGNFGFGHSLKDKLSIKYKINVFYILPVPNRLYFWPCVTLYFKL